MDIKKLQDRAEARTIELEERYFRVDSEVNEWESLLLVLGIPEKNYDNIESISIKVDSLIIEEY